MIEIEILNCNELNRLGTYQFFGNEMFFGRSKDNFIYLPLEELEERSFSLKLRENKAYISLLNQKINFHLNGKIYNIDKEVKIGDLVRFGSIEFKLSNFLEEKVISRKDFLNSRVEDIGQNNHDLLNLVQSLSK